MKQESYKLAEKARSYESTEQWREAERLYLLAAQQLATSRLAQDTKDRTLYDKAAKRCRRLAQLTVDS